MSAPLLVAFGECMAELRRVRIGGEPAAAGGGAHAGARDATALLALGAGGDSANTLVAAVRQGLRGRYLSRLGDDFPGRRVRATLAAEGIDTEFLPADAAAPTGLYLIDPEAASGPRFAYWRAGSAASRATPADFLPAALAEAAALLVTGVSQAISPSCAETAVALAHAVRARGALTAYDPNFRSRLGSAAGWRTRFLALAPHLSLVSCGFPEEAALLFDWPLTALDEARTPDGADHWRARAAEQAFALGLDTLVLREGAAGAVGFTRAGAPSASLGAGSARAAARPVAVVDPAGAGDAFNGGLLAGLLRGEPLEGALRRGARTAEYCLARPGTIAALPPAGWAGEQ